MLIIKRILIALILIVSIVLITAYFMPREYAVTKEITIDRRADSVFNYIRYFKNQNEFSAGLKLIRK